MATTAETCAMRFYSLRARPNSAVCIVRDSLTVAYTIAFSKRGGRTDCSLVQQTPSAPYLFPIVP
jgi:hypothetical protein